MSFRWLLTIALLLTTGCAVPMKHRGGRCEARGADGNQLREAAEAGETECVARLLDVGVAVDGATDFGTTLLHMATSAGHRDTVELLVSRGADIAATDGNDVTPMTAALYGGHVEIVAWLIERGSPVGFWDLQVAAHRGHVGLLPILLERLGNPSLTEWADCGVLGHLAASGSAEGMRFVLAHGADPNVVGGRPAYHCRQTPLGYAINRGDDGMTAALLDAGARIDKLTFERAVELGNLEILKCLERHGRKIPRSAESLVAAVERGNTDLVVFLLGSGVDANARAGSGDAPMHVALIKERKPSVVALIDHGAKVGEPHDAGRTILMEAARLGWPDLAELVLKKGVEVNARDAGGRTALMDATESGDAVLVRRLLDAGADVSFRDAMGETAQSLACSGRHKALIQLLSASGCPPPAPDDGARQRREACHLHDRESREALDEKLSEVTPGRRIDCRVREQPIGVATHMGDGMLGTGITWALVEGSCEKGWVSGRGRAIGDRQGTVGKDAFFGLVYEGELSDGWFHGTGTLSHFLPFLRVSYRGEWHKGRMHGQGVLTHPHPDSLVDHGGTGGYYRYRGSFAEGRYQGRGGMTFPDCSVFVGEWLAGRENGQGTKSWRSGSKYVGTWRDGEKDGQGSYVWSSGAEYSGQWRAGKMHGKGKQSWPNGDQYDGDWVENDRTGNGTMRYGDGRVYTGEWLGNREHGQGRMKYADGSVKSGVWKHGELVGR